MKNEWVIKDKFMGDYVHNSFAIVGSYSIDIRKAQLFDSPTEATDDLSSYNTNETVVPVVVDEETGTVTEVLV